MNNPMQVMMQFKQFMRNPQQYMQSMGIPAGSIQNPNQIIDYLMKNGKISQQDYNRAAQAAGELKNNPQFQQMLNGKM